MPPRPRTPSSSYPGTCGRGAAAVSGTVAWAEGSHTSVDDRVAYGSVWERVGWGSTGAGPPSGWAGSPGGGGGAAFGRGGCAGGGGGRVRREVIPRRRDFVGGTILHGCPRGQPRAGR